MADPVTSALLVIVAIAYLACGGLVVTAVAKVLGAWSASWRASRHPEPVDAALQGRAVAAMAAAAALANVTPPATDVVAYLGAPTGDDARPVGDGGLAVTRFRAGHPTVVFAQSALTSLSPAAVQSLAAHELAHVIRREQSSAAARYGWIVGYLALVLAGAGLTVAALVAARQLAGPALLATMIAAVAFLALQVAFDRREEIAADRFAVALTRDLEAAAELMRFYEDYVAKPLPAGGLARGWAQIERRWFATHPDPRARLEAMRRHLVDERAD
ncbi:M48 family metalloprotease [Pimelobacter simplex]|nr:M48 family metalloprotease [Pimelobacter simplex]